MGLRDTLADIARAHVREQTEANTYYKPGATARRAGDWIAILGTMAYFVSLFGVFPLLSGVADRYPGIHSRLGPAGVMAVLIGVPLLVAVLVWATVLMGGWRARLGVTVLGLLGTALTWRIARQLFVWATGGAVLPPNFTLTGLSLGSVLILLGGLVGTAGAYFGEWARYLDV